MKNFDHQPLRESPFLQRRFIACGLRACVLALLLAYSLQPHAAPGEIVPDFSIGTGLKKTSSWIPGPLSAVVCQPDGRIILAGDFEEYNGVPRRAIVRINPDGSIDPTFDPHDGATGGFATIDSVILEPDGKIMISGDFEFVNGKFQPGLARLCSNGNLDTTFGGVINESFAATWALGVQPDGMVIVGGQFSRANSNSENVNNIARFFSNGSLDRSFAADVGDLEPPMFVFSNGDFLLVSRGAMRKFKSDGYEDPDFFPPSGEFALLFKQPDDKFFITVPAWSAGALLKRLNPDGSVDTSFNSAAASAAVGRAYGMAIQTDGKFLVTSFSSLLRLNADGTPDPTLNVSVDFEPSFIVIPPGSTRAIVGSQRGSLKCFELGDIPPSPPPTEWPPKGASNDNGVAYWTGPTFWTGPTVPIAGMPDASFYFGATATVTGKLARVAAATSGGRIFVGGQFGMESSHGFSTHGIARLNRDGSPDEQFAATSDKVDDVSAVVPLPDGGAIVGVARGLLRLTRTGTVDPSFAQEIDDGAPTCLLRTEDDELVVGGGIHSKTLGWCYLLRLHPDGTLDQSFNSDLDTPLQSILPLDDGSYLVAGGGPSRPNLFRLNNAGIVDQAFNPDLSGIYQINTITTDAEKRILIGGIGMRGVWHNNDSDMRTATVVRLLPNGQLDRTFHGDLGPDYNFWNAGFTDLDVTSLLVQPDGKILCAGNFEQADGLLQPKIARLFPDGTLDRNFESEFDWHNDTTIFGLLPLDDGRIMALGTDSSGYATILENDPALIAPIKNGDHVTFSFRAATGRAYYVESSTNIAAPSWERLARVEGDNITHIFSDSTALGNRFFRSTAVVPPAVLAIQRYGPTNAVIGAGVLVYRVWFSEHVNNTDPADFVPVCMHGTLSGASVSSVVPGPGRYVDVYVTTGNGSGDLRLDVAATATIVNDDGEPVGKTSVAGEVYTIDDSLAHVVAVTRLRPMDAPTTAPSVTFRVTFDRPMKNIDDRDFAATVLAGDLAGVRIQSVSPSSGSAVNVMITTGSGNGMLRLDVLPMSGISDTSGNYMTSGFFTGETYEVTNRYSFKNSAMIEIPATNVARPYASTITVSDMPAHLTRAVVTLKDFLHSVVRQTRMRPGR